MDLMKDLIQGKYKGVPFYTRSENLSGIGQSRIDHKYPKTGVQYSEAMGREPFRCSIEIFFKGENYKTDFLKFAEAMTNPSPGKLYMPSFGLFEDIITYPADFSAPQAEIGVISGTVTFAKTREKPAPTSSVETSEQDVAEQKNTVWVATKAAFADSFQEPETLNNLITVIVDALGLADELEAIYKATRAIKKFSRKVEGVVKKVESYASLLISFLKPLGFLNEYIDSVPLDQVFSVCNSLTTIGNDLPSSTNEIIDGVIPSNENEYTVQSRTTTSTDINTWDPNTVERVARNESRISLVNTFRAFGLAGLYDAAARRSYTTTEDVDEVSVLLESIYIDLVENDTTDLIFPTIKKELEVLKGLTEQVLKNKKQQAYAVTTVKIIRPMSSKLLAYELYGELIKNETQLDYMAELIAGLNNSLPAYRMAGVVKVVEVGR